MKNIFKAVGGVFLAVALIFVSGCGNKNAGQAVLKVGNTSVTEKEFYYNLYESLGNSYSGIIEYDETADYEKIKNALQEAEKNEEYADTVKKQKIVYIKQRICDEGLYNVVKEKGVELSDEEKGKIDETIASVDDFFNSEATLSQIKEQYYNEDPDGENKAKEHLEKYRDLFFNSMAVENMEQLKEKYTKLSLINKVLEEYKNNIADDEEYVKKYYEKQLASQKESYTKEASAFDADNDYGKVICYYPAGLRYVKHILISSGEEDAEKLEECDTAIQELEAKESLTDDEKKQLEEAKANYDKLLKESDAKTKVQAEGVYKKLRKGGDFDALLKEYGKDPGMTTGSAAAEGYLIHETSPMVKEFLDAAMALKNPGDISAPVKSQYGYHIIKYIGDKKEGAVPYEELKDELLTTAMDQKRNDEILKYYDDIYEEMIKSNKAIINYDLLGMDKETYDRLYQEIIDTVENAE